MNEELALKTFVVFMKATKSVQDKMKIDLNKYGLTWTEFSVLEILYRNGKQTVQQISKAVLLASSSMTYVIDKLQEREYLIRSDCRQDRRTVYVSITDKGKALMDRCIPEHQKFIQDLFQEINLDEKKMMISLLGKIN
ncbi:MarR family winged helix-turn-helix transcriptional regulator [Bacillus sp. 03113]|uniref:MarR family winged helix-turn-helix transcriptional regulator n=1 Tax=Bacillus sp. 03113 TaxID=2578211 RepID=UPI0011431823|nr:MarR family transcriptional regulator [Bacillus sp. 03113]